MGKPVIMSTGMQTIESMKPSVQILEDAGIDYALAGVHKLVPFAPRDCQFARRDRFEAGLSKGCGGVFQTTASDQKWHWPL